MPASSSHDGPREPDARADSGADSRAGPCAGSSADDDAAAASDGADAAAEFVCEGWGPELIGSGA